MQENNLIRRVAQNTPKNSEFQSILPRSLGKESSCRGLIKVHGIVRWQRVAREVLKQMQWESFRDLEIIDEQSSYIDLVRDYCLDIWRPKKLIVDDTVVTLSQLQTTMDVVERKKKLLKPGEDQDGVIPIQAVARYEKWLKIRGTPYKSWSYNLFRSIGNSLGGMLEIADCTLRKENLKFFRISVKGGFAEIPTILMVEEGDQAWAVYIEWDYKFIPKKKASLGEFQRLLLEFENLQKILNSKNYSPAFIGTK